MHLKKVVDLTRIPSTADASIAVTLASSSTTFNSSAANTVGTNDRFSRKTDNKVHAILTALAKVGYLCVNIIILVI